MLPFDTLSSYGLVKTLVGSYIANILQVANGVSAGYDKVTKLFEDLSSYLNQLKVLEHGNLPSIPELKLVVVEVLVSVLDLCGLTAKYVTRRRTGKSFVPAPPRSLITPLSRYGPAWQPQASVLSEPTISVVNILS